MSYLFLDTTDRLVVGLLNDQFEWIELYESEERKSSAKIHGIIHELSIKNNIELSELSAVIQVAGPGSYTGMRVSDGIIQILEWSKIKSCGVYHFDIPKILGETHYCWYASAFKGETFIFEQDGDRSWKKLMPVEEAKNYLIQKVESGIKIFTHYDNGTSLLDTHYSSIMIKDYPKQIFSFLDATDSVKEIYYYRSLEEEFRPSLK